MKKFKLRNIWLRLVKPAIKKWVDDTIIPYLQKKINAGAIDVHVDGIIEDGIHELIDQL